MQRLLFVLASLALALPCLAQRSTPLQLLHPSGAANDQFGSAVAISGDTLVVGAYFDRVGSSSLQGSAHVYRWSGTGWDFEASLVASDGAAADLFGISVAISGDTVVVGAYGDDSFQGSASVFVRTGRTWTQQAKLIPSQNPAGAEFGRSVAIDGDTIVAGARLLANGTTTGQGGAFVFSRSGSTWAPQTVLRASDGGTDDNFGFSVALAGDTIIVGAPFDDVGPSVDQGSAYVFTKAGSTWTQLVRLSGTDSTVGNQFGSGVAVDGDTFVVGASSTNSAYVFSRSGGSWSQQAKLTPNDATSADQLGTRVGISGNTIVLGAPTHDLPVTDQGAAYVFGRNGATWTQQAKLSAPDGAVNDRFGFGVAAWGDTVVCGAFADDVGANADRGSAWVFSRIGTKWIGPDLQALGSGGAAGDLFGYCVALSGDTAIVGAANDDVGANADQGSAYIFIRNGTTWTQQAQLTATGGAAGDVFGYSVALSGDTAIVSAFFDDVGANTNQGSAYIFTRSGTTWTQQAQLTATGGAANDQFGFSVALSGNTAVVGANGDDVGANTDQGSAYIFTRSGTTWTQQAQLNAASGAAGDQFGVSVALFGDTALVGAWQDDVGANSNQGSASVFTRTGTIWTQQAQLTAAGGAANDVFGFSVALSGDTAVVGAYGGDVGANANQGSAFVFSRSGSTWTQQAQLTVIGGAAGDQLGVSVALSGDTAVVGANGDDVGANNEQGSAYVFTRSGTTWTQQAQLTATGGAANDQFGYVVALSGGTAVVGALFDDVGANSNQGSAWFFDVPASDFSLARNEVTDISYPTLAAALLPAQSGQQITATQAAWRLLGSLDTVGRSLILWSGGDLRTPSTSVLALGGSSSLNVQPGNTIEIYGQLRASGFTNLYADSFFLGSRGILTARTGSSLTINAPVATLQGQTRLEQGSALTFSGPAETLGPVTASLNSSLTTGGTFTNIDVFSVTSGTISTPLFLNRAQANVFGSSAIFGSFTNDSGATATIRSGTLFVFGSFTNSGTIVGTLCSSCLQTEASNDPGLDVGGDLTLGADANLNLPFAGAIVRVGGNYDASINSNARYDLASATLQLEGSGSEQTLEVMSLDIGASATGLDRAIAGHYPLGTLEIGPGLSTVRLVDTRDNDGMGQAACEAIYVGTLRINSGSRLINTGPIKIYYNTLINEGTVDSLSNLVRLGAACPSDLNGDSQVDDADFVLFLAAYNILDCADPAMAAGCPSDLNTDTVVDDADFVVFLVAYNELICP